MADKSRDPGGCAAWWEAYIQDATKLCCDGVQRISVIRNTIVHGHYLRHLPHLQVYEVCCVCRDSVVASIMFIPAARHGSIHRIGLTSTVQIPEDVGYFSSGASGHAVPN